MEKKSSLTFVLVLALTAGALIAFGGAEATAAEPEAAPSVAASHGEAPAAKAEDTVVTFAGLQIAIDPETGRLRPPTEEEAAALAQGMRDLFGSQSFAAASDTVVTEHKDGMLSAVLGLDTLNFTVLRSNGDGTYSKECVSSPEAAEAFVAAAPQPLADR